MKIGIHGINGKMGQAIAAEILNHPNFTLAAASVRNGHEWADKRIDEVCGLASNVRITTSLEQLCASVDVVIDFTRPDATQTILPICRKLKKPMMIGTTGFSQETLSWIEKAGHDIPIVLAANTSLGVNILIEVSRQVATHLGQEWNIDIFEAHHKNKIDAPSGTALRIGQAIASAQNSDFESRKRYPYTNKRKDGDIGFSVVRAGNIVGDHSVFFTSDYEQLEFTHRAQDRRIFAQGALVAAHWVVDKEAGIYTMANVLGIGA